MMTFLAALLLSSSAQAAINPQWCSDPQLEQVPTLADGRVVPLFSHARRARETLFGSKVCPQYTATEFYCRLSVAGLAALGDQCQPKFKYQHRTVGELIGSTPESAKEISPQQAFELRQTFAETYHGLVGRGEKNSGPATDLVNLLNRIDRIEAIQQSLDWKVLDAATHEWQPIAGVLKNTRADGVLVMKQLLAQRALLPESDASQMRYETWYERSHIFEIAVLIAIAVFALTLASVRQVQLQKFAAAGVALLIATNSVGITLRVLISKRGPVTNMYETVMWVGFGALCLGTILGLRAKNPKIWVAAIAGNTLGLLMMVLARGMLDPTIQPLVPVLRDNFWLSTHVTSITLSYACFALAWVMANYVLVRGLFGKTPKNWAQEWNLSIRLAIQIGTVFLAGGILLGGVWADYSWGRFWGWDPKETWSLIALLIYIAILHGRYAGWFKDETFTQLAAGAFLSVIMAWFGVNYILATGLHSYGFSNGGAFFIAMLTLAQLVILSLSILRGLRNQR